MKVLVTGAAGKLGSVTCRVLAERGFDVRATDRRFRPDLPVKLEIADLCDELTAYRLLDGCDALVHLGNYPNVSAGPSYASTLADNVRMNANYFYAAVDRGLSRIVFASSIQVMIPYDDRQTAPRAIPYLPLDGRAPRNPGRNPYGLSKEAGERLLETSSAVTPGLACTALRFPGLRSEESRELLARAPRPFPRRFANLHEVGAHLFFDDAARLIADVLERQAPGYHQYFPATFPDLGDYPLGDLLREEYPDVKLLRPVHALGDLIDTSQITEEVGWKPEHRLAYELERPPRQ
jgi:nucleoside-diphosphate-sugar epimerase